MNILLITYRRVDHIAKIIQSFPSDNFKIYVYSNQGYDIESKKDVAKVRSTVNEFVNQNKIHKNLYIDEHLPVEKSIPFAIDWFFSEVQWGIILEDDCLVNTDAIDRLEDVFDSIANTKLVHVNLHHKLDIDTEQSFPVRIDRVKLVSVWGWLSNSVTWKTVNGNKQENLKSFLGVFNETDIPKYYLLIFYTLYKLNNFGLIKTWDFIYAVKAICCGVEILQVTPSLITSKGIDQYSTNHRYNHNLNNKLTIFPYGFDYDRFLLANLYPKMLLSFSPRRLKNLITRLYSVIKR